MTPFMPTEMPTDFRPLKTIEDRSAFPAQSSVLDEYALWQRVLPDYQIPPVTMCLFLTRGDSDVYRVATEEGNFYLKIYRPPHSLALAEAEAQFVTALSAARVPMVKPVPRRGGGFAYGVSAFEGPRPALLFECAPGPLHLPLDERSAQQFGAAVAALHQAADSLPETYALPRSRFEKTAEHQLSHARPFLVDADYDYLIGLAARFYPGLNALS